MTQENNNWQQQVWGTDAQQSVPQSTPQPQAYVADPYAQRAAYGWQQPQPAPVYAPPQAYPAPEQPKRRGWIVGIVVILALTALTLYGMSSCNSMMSQMFGSVGALGETSSAGSSVDYLSEDAVGVIYLDGTIQYDGTVCSPEGLKEQLDIAESNPHIKALVLRVNSGGGTATASEEMTEYLAECSLPVVVSSASMNASAAYEISSQADYIYVAKTTSIGAIGTAMDIVDLSGLYDLLGIEHEVIASAESKDSSYGYRALTDEERAYYQNQVDQINETFLESVAAGRSMTIDEVRALATGLTFTGMEAVENGLADEIGTFEDALNKAAELAGMSTYTTVTLEPAHNYSLYDYLLGMETNTSTESIDGIALKKEL